MPVSSKNDLILVRYPFSDLSGAKVRPAVVVSASHSSQDIFIVPLTSKTAPLLAGEFLLTDWKGEGLNNDSGQARVVHSTPNLSRKNRRSVVIARWSPTSTFVARMVGTLLVTGTCDPKTKYPNRHHRMGNA
jgi:mRNA interferase MazF